MNQKYLFTYSGSIYLDSTSNVFLTRMSFLQNAVTSYGVSLFPKF